VLFVNGAAAGQVAGVSDFVAATDSVLIRPDLSIAPAVGDSFYIVGLLAPALVTDVSGGTGSGVIACSLYTLAGASAISGARVYIYNSALSTLLYQNPSAGTSTNGLSVFGLDPSTTYKITGQKVGYSYDSVLTYQTILTASSGKLIDTIPFTLINPGSPAAADLCHITVDLKTPGGAAIVGATVRFIPEQANAAKAGGNTLLPETVSSAVTDATGRTSLDVWKSSAVKYLSSDSTYRYTIKVAIPDASSGTISDGTIKEVIIRERVTIPDSANLRMEYYLTPGNR
jgi:hypothetical protein